MVVCVHDGWLGACLRIGLWLVVTETHMSCTNMRVMGEGGLMLRRGALVGTYVPSCYKCSEELRIDPEFLALFSSTTENASPQHPTKESRAQNNVARSL